MTGRRNVRLGTIAVLFTVVVLCVSVLAVLSVATVRAERVMSQRYAQQVTARSELENEGQRWLRQVLNAAEAHGAALTEADLPENTTLDGQTVRTTLTTGGRTLTAEVELDFDGASPDYRILSWVNAADWEEDEQVKVLH